MKISVTRDPSSRKWLSTWPKLTGIWMAPPRLDRVGYSVVTPSTWTWTSMTSTTGREGTCRLLQSGAKRATAETCFLHERRFLRSTICHLGEHWWRAPGKNSWQNNIQIQSSRISNCSTGHWASCFDTFGLVFHPLPLNFKKNWPKCTTPSKSFNMSRSGHLKTSYYGPTRQVSLLSFTKAICNCRKDISFRKKSCFDIWL